MLCVEISAFRFPYPRQCERQMRSCCGDARGRRHYRKAREGAAPPHRRPSGGPASPGQSDSFLSTGRSCGYRASSAWLGPKGEARWLRDTCVNTTHASTRKQACLSWRARRGTGSDHRVRRATLAFEWGARETSGQARVSTGERVLATSRLGDLDRRVSRSRHCPGRPVLLASPYSHIWALQHRRSP